MEGRVEVLLDSSGEMEGAAERAGGNSGGSLGRADSQSHRAHTRWVTNAQPWEGGAEGGGRNALVFCLPLVI